MNRTRIHIARFERKQPRQSHFSAEQDNWVEVCRDYVSLEPLRGDEYFQAQQVQSKVTTKAKAYYSLTLATVNTGCRIKIAKPTPVTPDDPNDDSNFRIFHIEHIVNVREENRTLEFMVQERV